MGFLGLACLCGFVTALVTGQEGSEEFYSYSPVPAFESGGYSSLVASNSYGTRHHDSPYTSPLYASPPSLSPPWRSYRGNRRGRGYRMHGSVYGRQSYNENRRYPIGPGYVGSGSGSDSITGYSSYVNAPGYDENGSETSYNTVADPSYSNRNSDLSGYNPNTSNNYYPAPTSYIPTTSAPATTALPTMTAPLPTTTTSPPTTTTRYLTAISPYLTPPTSAATTTTSILHMFPATAYNPFTPSDGESNNQPPVRSDYRRTNSNLHPTLIDEPHLRFGTGHPGSRPKTPYSIYNPRTGVSGSRYPRPGFVSGPGRRPTSYNPTVDRNGNGYHMDDLHNSVSTTDYDSQPLFRSSSYLTTTNNEQLQSNTYNFARKNPNSYFAQPTVPATGGIYSPSDYGPTYDSQYNNPLLAEYR